MSNGEEHNNVPMITIPSSRFGELVVPADSVFELPSGLIGFPKHTKFVMLDHKPPFAWLHSVDDPNLAFVVMDGSRFAELFDLRPPRDKEFDLQEGDDYAILVVVTVRPDPKMTTTNIKAPVFVNLRTRRGVQTIYDDPKYPTRYHLWGEGGELSADATKGAAASSEAESKGDSATAGPKK